MFDLTIIITTCKRLKRLTECIRSVKKLEPNCNILLMIDDNDWESYYYAVAEKIPFILSSEKREWIAQINLGIYACTTEYFVYLNDDMVFTQENQMQRALDIFRNKFPDGNGLITFDDGISNGKVATQGLSSKTYVKTLGGYLLDPAYVHYSGDKELSLVSMERNCYFYLSEIKIQHNHYSVTGERDQVYQGSENLYWKQDCIEFVKRWGEGCDIQLKNGTWNGRNNEQ